MNGVRLTHIGGPTVLLEIGGWRLLTDPTFDAPGGRYRFGWGASESLKVCLKGFPGSSVIDSVRSFGLPSVYGVKPRVWGPHGSW